MFSTNTYLSKFSAYNKRLFLLLIVRVPVLFALTFHRSTWRRPMPLFCSRWVGCLGADLRSRIVPFVVVLAAIRCCAIGVDEEACVTAEWLSGPHRLWQHWLLVHLSARGVAPLVAALVTLSTRHVVWAVADPNSKHWFTTSFLQPLPYLGSRKLSANEQFFVGVQTVVYLLQTSQIKQGVSFIAANKVYTSTNKTTIV